MGIFISVSISMSVTKEEWASVYGETLRLVEAFPFAEKREVPVRGIKTICLVPTKEREERYGWNNEEIRAGWFADGDYVTLRTAEDYYLPRDLVTEDSYDPDAPDAMFGMLPAYLHYSWQDEQFQQCYQLWDGKTQGQPYHMYLLAVACLIESRLGPKACVYGDITRGQCRKAVEMANKYLDKKIDLPARCDPELLLKRIKSFPISEMEMLKAYICLYLGTKDAAFGKTAREHFSESAFDEYWKDRLGSYQVTMRGFNDVLHDYLLWNFELEKIADYVSFTDKEGYTHYEDFVKRIMETRLYLKDKDCRDILKIDQEDERPYGISALLAQYTFGGAANRKVDRYIPLENMRNALLSSIGDKCNVNQVIDDYLKEDEECQKFKNVEYNSLSEEDLNKAVSHDASAVFTQAMEARRKEFEKRHGKYDISEFEDLPYYEAGDSMHPEIAEQVGSYFAFYRSITEEKQFTRLMSSSPGERCEWLILQNKRILLRDRDWEKIFEDIFENADSYARYYPMVRVRITGDGLINLIRALAVNDDFYQLAFELEKEYATGKRETMD